MKHTLFDPLLPRYSHTLVAVSGGADSMALLHGLLCVQKEHQRISVAHVNHKLRPQADAEQAFVRAFCAQRELPFYTQDVDVLDYATQTKQGVELCARILRYHFLQQTARQLHADCIALAHHMDDQAETLLLHLARGSGLQGLCGMPVMTDPAQSFPDLPLFRPLLHVSKAQILQYCAQNDLVYCTDQSNECTDYTRNYIRSLLENLREVNINFAQSCDRTCTILQQDQEILQKLAKKKLKKLRCDQGVKAKKLRELPAGIFARVVMQYAHMQGLRQDLQYTHIQSILGLCHAQSGKCIHLPHGFVARIHFDYLRIEKQSAATHLPPADGQTFAFALGTHTCNGYTFCVDLAQNDGSTRDWLCACAQEGVLQLDGAVLHMPDLAVRTRRAGDTIVPLGMTGKKLLKDYFCDRKIDKQLRNVPLIVRGSDVLAVLGVGIANSVKVTPQSEQIITFKRV